MRTHARSRRDGRPAVNGDPVLLADGGQQPVQVDVTALDRQDPGPQSNIGGVILAAGESKRFDGASKLLEPIDGKSLIRRAVEPFLKSCLEEIVLVVGHEEMAVREAVADLGVSFVRNEAYREGQSTSLHRGVEEAREKAWDAIVYGLGDMPYVSPSTIDVVVQTYLEGRGSIVAPAYNGSRGNPTLFGKDQYQALLEVTGDTGGRPVLKASSDVVILETGDPGVLQDVDVREDL